jgi:ParB/RepB/Spo0J family partition protein
MRFVKGVQIRILKPWAGNPRRHDEDIAGLVRSIEHYGWTNPILVQEKTNRVIAGHGRLEAAKQAGIKKVPVIYLKMTETEASAYTVADNKLAENSRWDEEALAGIMRELQAEQYDLTLMGFSDDDINLLLTAEEETIERTMLDEIPDPPKKPTTKRGQLWQLGKHRLLCGDSTEPTQVQAATQKRSADLVFTDPPYGVEYVGKTKDALTIKNDNLGDAGTMALVIDAARAWPLKPGGCFYVCGPAGDTETAFRLALRAAKMTLRQCLVWVKHHFVMGRQDYHWRHETILYGWADGAAHYFLSDRTQDTVMDEEANLNRLGKKGLIEIIKAYRRGENTSVWREDRPSRSLLRPTIKPIALIAKAIRNSSTLDQLVFDGFGGSGSTLIAAEHTNRQAVLIETDARYCDVTIERFKKTCGGSAKLIGTVA